MLAAVSLMVIFIISFICVRVSAIAMRLTGMPEAQARFQALSALTGTGFTTSEAEMIVNYPIRRKIIATLMVVGNLGVVSFASTLMISFLRTDAHIPSILEQIAWVISGLGLLYLFMTNRHVDDVLCRVISYFLKKYTGLNKRRYERLLQLGHGVSVVEHHLAFGEHKSLRELLSGFPNLTVLAVRHADGNTVPHQVDEHEHSDGDGLILVGPDSDHEALSKLYSSQWEKE